MYDKPVTKQYKVLRFLIDTFYPKMEVVGLENLPQTPCVIVGNHAQMNGPLAAELRLPFRRYIWCAGEMMNKEEVAEYAFKDFWSFKPRRVQWFYRILSHLIVPLSICLFNNAHTIPVYHDNRVVTTFRESVKQLQSGNHIVIFPEHNVKFNNIIYEFQNRFIDLARLYQRKMKMGISFVPMYIAPDLKKIFLGKPIEFRTDAPIDEQRQQICDYLMGEITRIACSQPLHTVVPYRNVKRSAYPKNVPCEVYHIEAGNG